MSSPSDATRDRAHPDEDVSLREEPETCDCSAHEFCDACGTREDWLLHRSDQA